MNNDMADQAWQQLYARIEQLLPRFLKGELHQIEYKPQNVTYLLEMPSEYRNEYQGKTYKLTAT
ncbi:MAG: hypothetical protein COX51_06195 [Syntrophobacteraceae bacterium CG23_combo_of_CG06-09_8_20_14_all_50_8]|nr:MAG: hypothetical protein COX51_06195 [Syntrophobacteraceae bacterium CG23_combo_of_CG06-09_8_20_14_all_50_8]